MTDADKLLAEIGERLAKASPGPWGVHATSEYWIKDANDEVIGYLGGHHNLVNNGNLIAHSRADIVKLKRMVECAKKHLAEHCLCSGDGQPDGITCVHCDALAQLNAIARGEE